MRVSLLTTSISQSAGGLFDAVRYLAKALVRCPGVSVNVLALEDEHRGCDLPFWDGVPVQMARVSGPSAFRYGRGLIGMLRGARPDLVHVEGLWTYPSLACRLYSHDGNRKPYIVSPHGMLDPWALRHSAWKKRLAGFVYQNGHLAHAACIHAVSESEALSIRALGFRNPVCVIPNGVEMPVQSGSADPEWSRAVPESARVLLYLGRLHPKKNLVNLLKAWKLLESSGSGPAAEWHLVIAGWDEGGYAATLAGLCEELAVPRVHFVGPQFGPRKSATFRRASAFILPSLSEGLPLTILEAWAHGLPVIMTGQCNLPLGFEAEAAIPIETDPAAIAAGMTALFSASPDRLRDMGRRGCSLAATQFCWQSIASRMQEVYEWILEGGARPNCVLKN